MQSTLNFPLQPPERLLDEFLRIRLHAGTMSYDQFLEVPRKQPFEGSPGDLPVRERQPDVERNAATRSSNTPDPGQCIAKGLALHDRMNLDEIVKDDRAGAL
jgi:hypothetical protein